jgi:hypothetical protein
MDQQRTAPPPIDVARLNLLLVGLLLTGLALYVVVQTMRGGTNALVTAAVLIGGVIWMVAGRRVWWMPIPIAASIGGLIWVGFRIYTHELALMMTMVALLPALAINSRALEQYRPPLPWYIYALPAYLLAHMVASFIINRYMGGSGFGNILRTYMGALWPLVFLLSLYHYGDSRWVRITITLVYISLLVRVVIGLYSYYFPGYIFFRGFNAFFLLSEYGATELRDAPLRLLIMTLALSSAARRPGAAAMHFLVAMLSAWLLLMGSGRVTVGMLGLVPVFWLMVQRKFGLLFLFLITAASLVLLLNLNPGILDSLPRGPQRALSILIFGDILDVQARLEGSNYWHRELFRIGKERWLDSPVSILFGNRVHPFDLMGSITRDFHFSLQVAANVTRYERSLWTVLATTGLVGGLLYVFSFIHLLRAPVRELRRHRIADPTHAVYFFAMTHTALFVLFSSVHGSFPGVELMWTGLAFVLYQDQRKVASQAPPPAPAKPSSPQRLRLH